MCWKIQTSSWLDVIELRFITVDIEGNNQYGNCNDDYLQVYDGKASSFHKIKAQAHETASKNPLQDFFPQYPSTQCDL